MNITKKELTPSIGLILMFALGWIASGLVDKLTCDNHNQQRHIERSERGINDRLQQRLNRSEQLRQKKYLEQNRYRQEENNERPKQFRERRVRPQVTEEVPN